MSERMTCPGCHSHTSSVLHAVREGDPCPHCGLPADTILQVAIVQQKRGDEALRAEVERLTVENGRLIAERDKLRLLVEDVRDALNCGESMGYDLRPLTLRCPSCSLIQTLTTEATSG